MKRLFIVTMNKYPDGDAGAVRQHIFAKLFMSIGYKPFIIGYGEKKSYGEFEGVEYISFRGKIKNKVIRLLYRLLFGIRSMIFLNKRVKNGDVLLVVDLLPIAFYLMQKCAKKNGAILIHDSVEWYSPEEFKNGKRSIEYKLKEYTNTRAINKYWKVIAISRYLEEHFKKKGIDVVRVPVIFDVLQVKKRLTLNNEKIIFVYAGAPGRKDYLKVLVSGFAKLTKSECDKIQVILVGISTNQLIEICGVKKEDIAKLGTSLNIIGRVERNIAQNYVANADYTMFIRDENLRYAKAGFPTKFVESMSYGTPVICNISSNLNDYLLDSKNGFIVEGHTSEAFLKAIRKAISCSLDERNQMRQCARETAEKYFDYRNYLTEIKKFINHEE